MSETETYSEMAGFAAAFSPLACPLRLGRLRFVAKQTLEDPGGLGDRSSGGGACNRFMMARETSHGPWLVGVRSNAGGDSYTLTKSTSNRK